MLKVCALNEAPSTPAHTQLMTDTLATIFKDFEQCISAKIIIIEKEQIPNPLGRKITYGAGVDLIYPAKLGIAT